MSMYLYTVEKELSSNYTMDDIQELNKLMTNSDNIHHLLGKLFNVDKEENFRSKYNILYKVDTTTTFKLIIKSDIPMDREQVAKNKIKILSEERVNFKNGQELSIMLDVAPFRKDGEHKTKRIIKEQNGRIAWLTNKLTHNNECEIKSISELSQVMNYMEHKDKTKGALMLTGYRYSIDVIVKDTVGFTELVSKGIGPQKNYGFGLMEIA